ncbi:MAG TPA: HAMP domain-containing sensor histidine kinase [Planctomycetota bacterium]|nr:HAMP domain-containing sensor histidine kinase [Planctomycetota bacterium]
MSSEPRTQHQGEPEQPGGVPCNNGGRLAENGGPAAPPDLPLTPWVELLIECHEVSLRRRILLEAVLGFEGVTGAALWSESQGDGAWTEMHSLSRPGEPHPETLPAPLDLLPAETPAAQVEAAANPARPPSGAGADRTRRGARILLQGRAPRRTALVWTSAPDCHQGQQRAPDHAPGDAGLRALLALFVLTETPAPALPHSHGQRELSAPSPRADDLDDDARRARHDLRNLMAGILAAGELAAGRAGPLGPGERQRFAAILDHECRRAGELITDGLHAPTGGSRECALPMHTVRSTVSAERPLFEAAGIELELTVDLSRRLARTRLRAGDLSRIMHNLLTNAREAFGPPAAVQSPARRSPTVTVHLSTIQRQSGACLRLRIQDNGPGIPGEIRAHIFRDGFSHGKPGGSGLGLAVVRDCVARAEGQITCQSLASGGTRFELTLPAAS